MQRNGVIVTALLGAMMLGLALWASGVVPQFAQSERFRTSANAGYPIRFALPAARPLKINREMPIVLAAAMEDEVKVAELAEELGIDPASLPTAQKSPIPAETRNGLVPLAFDLARYGAQAEAASPGTAGGLRDNKQLVVGGTKVGSIALVVGEGATVSVDRQALLSLVGDRDPALAASLARVPGDQVTFEALRSRDVAIRYDPLADTVVIESKS